MNEKIELYKVKREIEIHGKQYTFERIIKDEYGEETKVKEQVETVLGLFHTSKGYVTKNTSDGGTIKSKGQPKILMIIDEQSINLKQDDVVEINGNVYKLVDKNDILNFGIIYDVSLEVVLDGNS